MEGRPLTKENREEPNPHRTPSRESGPSGLDRVRQAAKGDKKLRFTALLHHVTIDLLGSSYASLKKRAAAGVDGMTWEEYGEDLERRITDLHGRLHSGAYRARPSRRAWILKDDGRKRPLGKAFAAGNCRRQRLPPLGIAALEDKIVQHAVGTVLNQIGEEDFLGFSYGFRPGRGQHQALDALYVGITSKKVNWVLDLDIRSFFDKNRSRLDGPVRGASDGRPAHRSPDPEMVEGGRSGGWPVVRDGVKGLRKGRGSHRSWLISTCIMCSMTGWPHGVRKRRGVR